MIDLLKDESLDDLDGIGMKIIQKKSGFRFGNDSICLCYFLKLKRKNTILDIGTGSGIIPLQTLALYPESRLYGVEIQEDIANMATRTVKLNHIEDKVTIVNKNIKEFEIDEKIDVIVSNPPYMKTTIGKISDKEIKATSRHELTLNLEELLVEVKRLLKVGGSFNMVYRTERFNEVILLLNKNNIFPKRCRFIYTKNGRESKLFMIEALKGRRCQLVIEEPLYFYNEDGSYTEELKSYYYPMD